MTTIALDPMAERQQGIIGAVRQYGDALFGFIRSRVGSDADAEDVLQDVWVQLGSQPELSAIEQVGGWLYRVARNKITDRYRKKRPSALEDLSFVDVDGGSHFREILLAVDDDPDARMLRDLFWRELEDGLAEMPEEQRLVFVQNELEDRTLQAIADEQGENLKTIISRKRYAVKRLQRRLAVLYNELITDR
ncbi:MAG: sigma-70 family RNA polymerase sigma factor [Flavobacteriales bacterium]|nr:sigma-70 family RNA polymerase sigma factor [Flavobacteriales bacterium]